MPVAAGECVTFVISDTYNSKQRSLDQHYLSAAGINYAPVYQQLIQ
jgi:hypothetical protein